MGLTKPDPGQDPRGALDLMPIWNILDTTPEGWAMVDAIDDCHVTGLSTCSRLWVRLGNNLVR
jgi:predicted dithiol-disulfide oxidoreductase (DUF899 family)